MNRRPVESQLPFRTASLGGYPKRVFVCLSTDWHGHPCSLSHIFKIVAQREPVIWINSIGLRRPRFALRDFRRLWHKLTFALRERPPVFASGGKPKAIIEPRVLPYHHLAWVRRLNSWIIERQVRPYLRVLCGPDTQTVFITTNPAAVDVVRRLGADQSLYYCMDEYAAMPETDDVIVEQCEPAMLRAVDRVLATSLTLRDTKRHPQHETVHLPQGVDYQHFQIIGDCPPALRDLPRPIIGFQGIIGARVDLDLFEKIAQRFPQASLVLLGKKEVDLARFARYPNVHHFNAVPYTELPRWASRFDIGLIAYKRDGHTASVNPLKLLEYLAMGQAVVSMDLPELARHSAHVGIARDHAEYLALIDGLIARYPFSASEVEARRAYVKSESWDARAQQLFNLCDALALPARETSALGAVAAPGVAVKPLSPADVCPSGARTI